MDFVHHELKKELRRYMKRYFHKRIIEKHSIIIEKSFLSIFFSLTFLAMFLVLCFYFSEITADIEKFSKTFKIKAQASYIIPQLTSIDEIAANQDLIRLIWGGDGDIGIKIARCESGLNAKIISLPNYDGTVDIGLFQINSVHNMPDMINATANTLYAYSLYKMDGTSDWNSSKSCWEAL